MLMFSIMVNMNTNIKLKREYHILKGRFVYLKIWNTQKKFYVNLNNLFKSIFFILLSEHIDIHNTPDTIKNEPNKHSMFKVVLNNKYTANNVINGQEYIIGETID